MPEAPEATATRTPLALEEVMPTVAAGGARWSVRLPSGDRVLICGERIEPQAIGEIRFRLDDGTEQSFALHRWESARGIPYLPGDTSAEYLVRRAHALGLAPHTAILTPGLWFAGMTGSWSWADLEAGIPFPDPVWSPSLDGRAV